MKYVVANLKMNLVTAGECDQYLDTLRQEWLKQTHHDDVRLVVCPSFLYTERFVQQLPSGVFTGAQDAFFEARGAYTGETSALSLKDAGIHLVLCGHSERRTHEGETDEVVAKKVDAVLAHDMTAIICVGETKEEREHGDTAVVIADQVTNALQSVSDDKLANIIIAYEPRWAIGTGATPSTQDIVEVRIMIRKVLVRKYGRERADTVGILYGGSVNTSFMNKVCIDADMDGVLVGKESLNAKELITMVEALSQ